MLASVVFSNSHTEGIIERGIHHWVGLLVVYQPWAVFVMVLYG